MKYFISFLLLLAISCQSSKDINEKYFYDFNHEIITPSPKGISQLDQTKALLKRELKKYRQTGNRKFLISSKYAQMFVNHLNDDRIKQVSQVYELLRLNNNQSDYISIACNYNLAGQFEMTSPELSMKFLNEAISLDEKIGKKYHLPHLYAAKAKRYYNKEDYTNALYYFDKALKTYDPSDLLYIASMHNNFAMCYDKMNKMDRAIKEAYKALDIMEHKVNLIDEDKFYIHYWRGDLANYLLKKKDYKNAEKILTPELNFFKNIKPYDWRVIRVSEMLSTLYNATHENTKLKELVDFVKSIEPDLRLRVPTEKIAANNIIKNYYLDTNDLVNFKIISKKLDDLNNQQNKESDSTLTKISSELNLYSVKSINQKYNYQIANKEKKIWILLFFILFSVFIFGFIFINNRRRNKKQKELIEKEKLILETNKKILEQDLTIKKNKIEDLHLNLNLKVEAEKVFLENIKKIKKNKHVNTEEILQDLFLKINNLIQMSNKGNDLMNESSIENKIFTEKLSETFPFLSEQDKKLCTYFKLGLSSKEVSLLENITDGSARVYKARMKSKMKLDKDTDLEQFLNTL